MNLPRNLKNNCQNESVTTKTSDAYGYKNLCWYIIYLTVMVAFRKISPAIPHGVPTYGYTQRLEHCDVVYENNCKHERVTTKPLILIGTRTCVDTYYI